MRQPADSLQTASKGASIGIAVYIVLATAKLICANIWHSASLFADGLNNLTDIVASVTIFIGLWIAKKPADDDHFFGHAKFEPLACLVTSLIMFVVGVEVIRSGVMRLVNNDYLKPSIEAAVTSFLSMVVLFATHLVVKRLATKTKSLGLKASAKDLLNDAIISLGTMLAIIGAVFEFPALDTLMSVLIGLLIIKTAYDIFSESTFALSDGFDQDMLENYRHTIMKHPKVREVTRIRGRVSGLTVYVDITVEIDGELTVTESHHITQEIEQILAYNYGVYDVDVHVEPFIKK